MDYLIEIKFDYWNLWVSRSHHVIGKQLTKVHWFKVELYSIINSCLIDDQKCMKISKKKKRLTHQLVDYKFRKNILGFFGGQNGQITHLLEIFSKKTLFRKINGKVSLFLELEFQKLEFLISYAIVALLSWNLSD